MPNNSTIVALQCSAHQRRPTPGVGPRALVRGAQLPEDPLEAPRAKTPPNLPKKTHPRPHPEAEREKQAELSPQQANRTFPHSCGPEVREVSKDTSPTPNLDEEQERRRPSL